MTSDINSESDVYLIVFWHHGGLTFVADWLLKTIELETKEQQLLDPYLWNVDEALNL